MQDHRETHAITQCPSFRDIAADVEESDLTISTVHLHQAHDQLHQEKAYDDSSEDFDFTFVTGSPINADEIFSDGQICASFPFFNRQILIPASDGAAAVAPPQKAIRLPLRRIMTEDRDFPLSPSSSSSSESDELDRVPARSFCVWTPGSVPASPERCKKSSSTGSCRRWTLRDLVTGRSNSGGKEKFVFVAPNPNPNPKRKAGGEEVRKKGKEGRVTELDMVTAYQVFYGRSKEGQGVKGGRQLFLPYRVGFFAGVTGINRSRTPF